MAVIVFFALHWYLSLFTQTFFNHRYSAHGMFTMSRFWEKFWFILTFIFQGSSYLSPYVYGILHRLHHTYADTPNDPHSPKYSKNLFDMMWQTKIIYNKILNNEVQFEPQYYKGVPQWDFIDKLGDTWAIRIGWGLLYAAVYYLLDAQLWMYFVLLPIQWVMGPFHGAIINWFAHKYGYRNHEVKDTSKNFLPVDFLMLGESYHNNHHYNGNSANFGEKWHELDPVYIFIRLFNGIGMIKLKTT